MPKRSSRPRDINSLAKAIVDEATGEASSPGKTSASVEWKNPAAVELGRLGGKKGGPARAKKLTAERRKEIAQKAARIRWSKSKGNRTEDG